MDLEFGNGIRNWKWSSNIENSNVLSSASPSFPYVPYSGKLSREKTFAHWQRMEFSRIKLSWNSLPNLHGCGYWHSAHACTIVTPTTYNNQLIETKTSLYSEHLHGQDVPWWFHLAIIQVREWWTDAVTPYSVVHFPIHAFSFFRNTLGSSQCPGVFPSSLSVDIYDTRRRNNRQRAGPSDFGSDELVWKYHALQKISSPFSAVDMPQTGEGFRIRPMRLEYKPPLSDSHTN